MTHKEFTPIGIYIGFLALLIQVVDQLLAPMMPIGGNGGFGWMGFLGWATYFMAGCTVKNGVRAFIGMVIGMLLSILIIVLSNLVSGLGFFATPLVLLVTVSIILHLELAPEYLSFVPGVFVGSGAFFGCMTYVPGATFSGVLVTESIYAGIGMMFGWLCILFRAWYEPGLSGKKHAVGERLENVQAR